MRELRFLVAERRICISCREKFNIPLKLDSFSIGWCCLPASAVCLGACWSSFAGMFWEQGMVAEGDFRDLSSSWKINGSGCSQIGGKRITEQGRALVLSKEKTVQVCWHSP